MSRFGADMVCDECEAEMRTALGSDRRAQKAQQDEEVGRDLFGEGQRRAEYVSGNDIHKGEERHHNETYTNEPLFNVVKYFIHQNNSCLCHQWARGHAKPACALVH